jgi:hypothetical protein
MIDPTEESSSVPPSVTEGPKLLAADCDMSSGGVLLD